MVPEHHPCAVVLSGGLDSSIIASLLKTEMRDMPFTTITASYAEGRNDDLEYARHLVDHLGAIDHQELQVNAEAVETNFLAVQIALEEPLHDQVYITQYLIYKRIADLGFRVALNGQGADEFWVAITITMDSKIYIRPTLSKRSSTSITCLTKEASTTCSPKRN